MILLKFNDSDVKNAFESVVNGLPESKYDATFKENTIALIENQYQSYYTPFMYVQGESDSKQSAITAFKLTLTPFFMRYINIGIQETYFNGLTYGNEAKETQEQIINEGTKTSDNPVNSIYQNLTNRVDRNGNNKNTLTRPDGRTPFGALEEDRGVLSPLFEMVNAFSMLLVSPDDECYCDELCDTFGFEIEKLYAQMNNLQTEVSAISDDVNKNTGAITELSEKVTQNTGDISTLKNDVSTNTSDISALNDRVTQNRSDITQLESDMAEAKTDISENTTDISNLSTRVTSAEDNITAHTSQINQIDETLKNKVDIIKKPASNFVAYVHINGNDEYVTFTESAIENTLVYRRATDGGFNVSKGTSGTNAANMENIADVEAKIPSITNLADVTKENTFTDVNHFTQHITSFGVEVGVGNANDDEYDVSIQESGIEIFHYISGSKANSLRITENQIMTIVYPSNEYNIFDFPNKSGTLALTSDIPAIPEYTSVDSVIYDTTNGAIIAYDGAHEIHIPLLAGENVTIDASEDNKKIVISAAGGGGAGDVTAAGNNTYTGTNYFEGETAVKADLIIENAHITNRGYGWDFPLKSGTVALTSDIKKEPIYFISFYANEPSEPCHLSGTLMSKNSYGTGQKTSDEFAVILADNFYTTSNEGLAVYGRITAKDMLCLYSEDGYAIRCLDEENSDVELPTLSFFIMETEL